MYSKVFVDSSFIRLRTASYITAPLGATGNVVEGDKVETLGSRSGTSLPGFRSIIRAGGNANTDFTSDRESYSMKPMSQEIRYHRLDNQGSAIERYSGLRSNPPSLYPHLAVDTAGLGNEVLTRLQDRIRAERSNMNGMLLLGELRETIHMIRHPAEAITRGAQKLLLNLNKGKKRVAGLSPKYMSSEWTKIFSGTILEANFGWAPLLSDVKALAVTAAKIVHREPHRRMISSTGHREAVASGTYVIKSVDDLRFSMGTRVTWTDKTEFAMRMQACMNIQQHVAESAIKRASNELGFTAENVVSTVYNLIPLSFLADYISNLGDIIDGATTDTSNVLWSSRTERRTTTTNIVEEASDPTPYLGPNYPLDSISGANGHHTRRRVSLNRYRNNDVSAIPSFQWVNPLDSVRKMANVISLLNEFRHPQGFQPGKLSSIRF